MSPAARPVVFEADPVKAAVVGLVVIALLLALALNLNTLPLLGGGRTYQGEFADTAGLQVGEEVRIAGVKAGEVTDIALAGDRVLIGFRVRGQRLGRDTGASIEIKTLLGQHYLRVEPRGPGDLPPGAVIPLARTRTPVQIAPTLQKLTTTVEAIDTAQLSRAFDTLAVTFRDAAPRVRDTLAGLSALSRSVAGRDQQIRDLLRRANGVSGLLAARDADVVALITSSNRVLEVLHRRRDDIRALLAGTRELSAQVSAVVADNDGTLRPALDRLAAVLDVLRRNDDDLGRILDRLPRYLGLLASASGNGRWLDTDLKVPRGAALCDNGTDRRLADLLNPLLSRANQAVNGASAPCLPFGPAAGRSGGGR
jgi:phospholipid/cholesterol/gamma-HCH transport system substrate-binding protein